MENINNILVVSRMTSNSRKAIHFAVSLARKYDAKILVLHLVSNPVDMMAVNAPGLFLDEEYKNYKNSLQEAKEQLDKVIKQEIESGVPIQELISDHDSVKEIVRVVNEEKIDLIVMRSHEEGRIEHALFGGEHDATIRKMPCSILLVKQDSDAVKLQPECSVLDDCKNQVVSEARKASRVDCENVRCFMMNQSDGWMGSGMSGWMGGGTWIWPVVCVLLIVLLVVAIAKLSKK